MKPEFYRLSKKTGACVLEVHPLDATSTYAVSLA
jgi:hypothetical protein